MTRWQPAVTAAFLALFLPQGQSATPSGETAALKKRVEALEATVIKLQLDFGPRIDLLEMKPDQTIWLDPASPHKYGRLVTDTGAFLVSIEDSQPYLDGYKVRLHMGNPSTARYVGFTIHVQFGPRPPADWNQFAAWNSTLHTSDVSFTETLEPGSWNPIDLILAPITPGQFGHLKVSMTTNTVSLATTRR
jgi:hypothetical protein